MSPQKLSGFVGEIKALIGKNKTQLALELFQKGIRSDSQTYDKLIILSSRFFRISEIEVMNLASFKEIEVEMTGLLNAIIFLLNNLHESELSED